MIYLPTLEKQFQRGEDDNLVAELLRIRPDDPLNGYLRPLLAFMRGGPLPETTSADRRVELFLRHVGEVARLVDTDSHLPADLLLPARKIVGSEYDFIDQECQAPWTVAKVLNFIAVSRIKPTRKAAVIATMRNDGVSMLEFIAHYRALGFEHIFIYSNDNADGTTEMLEVLADAGVITYINNVISENTYPQRKAFEHSVHFLHELRDFQWVLYVDSDEFLLPAPRYGFDIENIVAELHKLSPNEPPLAVCHPWKWFGGHHVERSDALLLERFKYSRNEATIKCLVRLSDVFSMSPLHFPIGKRQTFFVDACLNKVEHADLMKRRQLTYEGGQLNHYWNKSFQEFAVKKLRGDLLPVDNEHDNAYKRDFEQFFAWNVPARDEYYNPCPPIVVDAVRAERDRLLELDGVRELDSDIQRRFTKLLEPFGGPGALTRMFSQLASQFPNFTPEAT